MVVDVGTVLQQESRCHDEPIIGSRSRCSRLKMRLAYKKYARPWITGRCGDGQERHCEEFRFACSYSESIKKSRIFDGRMLDELQLQAEGPAATSDTESSYGRLAIAPPLQRVVEQIPAEGTLRAVTRERTIRRHGRGVLTHFIPHSDASPHSGCNKMLVMGA